MSETKINIFQNDLNNQIGSHTELIYATTQGKKAIVNSLMNKGVDASQNDTLIQLSDKINNISVDNSKETLLGFLLTEASSSNETSLGISPFFPCKLPNGFLAIYSAGKIYVGTVSGNYTDIASFISNAQMSINVTTPSATSYAYINCSNDGKTILSYAFDEAGTIDLYDVNYETSQITFIKSITGFLNYRSQARIAITNDRSLICYYENWDTKTYLIKVDDTSVKSESLAVNASSTNTKIVFDEDSNTLFFIKNDSIEKFTYSVSEQQITFSKVYKTPISNYYFDVDKFNKLLIRYKQPTTVDGGSVLSYEISVANLLGESLEFSTVNVTVGKIISTIYFSPTLSNVSKLEDGTFNIKFYIPDVELSYNSQTNSLTVINSGLTIIQNNFGNYNTTYTSTPMLIIFNNESSKRVCFCPNIGTDSGSSYKPGSMITITTTTTDKKVVGFCRYINDVQAYYLRDTYSIEDINSGKFDVSTVIKP